MRKALASGTATATLAIGVLLSQVALAQGNSTADQFLPRLKPGITRGIGPAKPRQTPEAPIKPAPNPPVDGAAHGHRTPEALGHGAGEQQNRSEGLDSSVLSTLCMTIVTLPPNRRLPVSHSSRTASASPHQTSEPYS